MTAAAAALARRIEALGLERLRIGWCDLHGVLRGKTLIVAGDAAGAAERALQGIGMVGTMLLKDSSERTVAAVFDPAALASNPALAPYAGAANVLLHADPQSLVALPWAAGTGWMRAMASHEDGTPAQLDTRRALVAAVAALSREGLQLRCGLELEFHVHRIEREALAPAEAGWPGEPPAVRHSHPGYRLLAEEHADTTEEVLAIVQRTALGLGMPLASLEIELGPSQFEAVFAPLPALEAADAAVQFRSAVRQALRRAGWLASFVCRPPLPASVASGWHLHQSLADLHGESVMAGGGASGLSARGEAWLAGLLAHAGALAALCAPSLEGATRLSGSLMAPRAAVWARENRGAMLRVCGRGAAARIENRIGEPMANPYLVIAAQIHAGLDGLARGLVAPAPTDAPYAEVPAALRLPASLGEALDALEADRTLGSALGPALASTFLAIKRHEVARWAAAEDRADWCRREYFGRF
jgi:glutamine synthetase